MTLGLYLSRQILRRILGAGATLLLLGLTLDLAANGAPVAEEGGSRALLEYALLRLPLLAVTLTPPAILIGAALGFLMLAARSELTALRAAGAGTLRLLALLVPLALVLGAANGLLGDRLRSQSEARLAERFPRASETQLQTEDLWVRGPGVVASFAHIAPDARSAEGVTLHLLDDDGRIAGRIAAASAQREAGGWLLTEARVRPLGGRLETHPTYRWSSAMGPAEILRFAGGEASTSAEAAAVLAGDLQAVRGDAYYRTRLMRGYADWLVPAVLILLAARAGFAHGRIGDGARKAGSAVALGFLYIAIDGFAAAMSQTGAVSAPVAAFAPLAAFAALGLWSVVTHEG
ncbi:LptF/LptG family permease [Albimonas pacifica]|uniref:LPS export ABC transporter permease LptG n=1 Tax=Albimonas pacifica TaxID=1114924 RepID=A0A1I3BPW4_9RHOB|nr:LptF/LptG family permease [Albimonas pacifica]SFH64364.1 LPS export ABC transporter permease LptG [Albimonas pacifica]